MQSILITGANGFVGTWLCRYYSSLGYRVIGVGRRKESSIPGIRYYALDLCTDKIDSILTKYKPSLLIHCAGNASVPQSISNPVWDFDMNAGVLYRVLESCRASASVGMRIINLSSAAVYGNPIKLPISEDDRCAPISPYALNKMIGEEVCRYYRNNYDMDIICARIFSAYGPGLRKQIFWDMYQKIKTTGEMNMFGTGNETRDFIYISDLVNAIHCIVQNAKAPVINIANGKEIRIREIAEIFADNMNIARSKIIFNQVVRAGDPLNWQSDNSLLLNCGYEQKIEMDTGIKNYVRWVNQIENES